MNNIETRIIVEGQCFICDSKIPVGICFKITNEEPDAYLEFDLCSKCIYQAQGKLDNYFYDKSIEWDKEDKQDE